MNRHHWPLVACAAAAVLFAACSDDNPPTATASEASELHEPSQSPDYVLLRDDDSDPDQVVGEPGAYALTARGSGRPPLAVLEVPAGYSNFGIFALVPEGFPETMDPLRSVQYWSVDSVFVDPCRMDEGAREAGTTAEDLAEALAGQERTSVTEPKPVTLGDHDGFYMELTAPSDIVFEDCALGYYAYWQGLPDDAQHTVESPGTVDRAWILDVDGTRVVLVAAAPPEVTDAQVTEMIGMVESVRFVDAA